MMFKILLAGLLMMCVGIGMLQAQNYGTLKAGNPIPLNSQPTTISAIGTTLATTATLPADPNGQRNTYICGFSIRANATGAANVQATVTGINTGTMTFQQFVAPLATGIGIVEEQFNPCQPASANSAAINVISGAAGSGGNTTVNAWGYWY